MLETYTCMFKSICIAPSNFWHLSPEEQLEGMSHDVVAVPLPDGGWSVQSMDPFNIDFLRLGNDVRLLRASRGSMRTTRLSKEDLVCMCAYAMPRWKQ